METFVKHPEFQQLNIGFALDEGICKKYVSVAMFSCYMLTKCNTVYSLMLSEMRSQSDILEL